MNSTSPLNVGMCQPKGDPVNSGLVQMTDNSSHCLWREETARNFFSHPLGTLTAESSGLLRLPGEVVGVQGHRGQELLDLG